MCYLIVLMYSGFQTKLIPTLKKTWLVLRHTTSQTLIQNFARIRGQFFSKVLNGVIRCQPISLFPFPTKTDRKNTFIFPKKPREG